MGDAKRMLFNHRVLTIFIALVFMALFPAATAFAQEELVAAVPLTATTQPAAISVVEKNQEVTLHFVAKKEGSEVSYQWFKSADGTPENGEAIEGATAGSLETEGFEEKGIRYYYCAATVGEETVTSDVAAVAYTGLPVLYVNSEIPMKDITKGNYVFGDFKLVYEDGSAVEYQFTKKEHGEKAEGIKGCGNSTWQMPKKGYAFKFDEKQAFFGLAAAKEWCISANYADKTLLRNVYASLLANDIFNAGWNPSFHPVEVVWGGVYQGNYILCEMNTVGDGRVNVQNISDYSDRNIENGSFVDQNGDGLVDLYDGGFILEIDDWRDAEFWFETEKAKAPVALRDPDEASEEIQEHVRDVVQVAENLLYAENFTDATNGWRKYFDEESVIDWFFVNEIARNHDAKDSSSIYKFFSPADGKLHYGPIWDFDVGFGNDGEGQVAAVTGWYIKNGFWTARMFEDPLFVKSVIDRWNEKKEALDASVDTFLSLAGNNSLSAECNFMKWDVLGKDIYHNSAGFEDRLTYESEVNYMNDWLLERISWINNALNKSFTLSYKLDGGTLATPNPEVFLYGETKPFTLNNPTKKGSVFVGWSGDGIQGLAETVEITGEEAKDQEFTANWKPDIATFNASFAQNEFVYNGAAWTPDVVVSRDETALIENTDYTVSFANNVNAGEATVTITGIGDYAGVLEKTFAIAPKPVTLTLANASKMYGENDPEFTYTVEGLVERDGVLDSLKDVKISREIGEDLGEYAISATVKAESNPNYAVTFEGGTFKIDPNTKEIVVTVTGHYDELVYDGEEHSVDGYDLESSYEAYSTGFVSYSGDGSASGTSAKKYDMGLKDEDFRNTSVNFTNVSFVVEDGFLDIMPKPVTISIDSCGKVYGEKDPESGFSADTEGLVTMDDVVEELVGVEYVREAGEDAGEYAITADFDADLNPNYAIIVDNGVYTIEPKPATVKTGSATKEYDGTPLTKDEASIEGLVSGEAATVKATGSQTDVGSSENTYSIAWDTAKEGNYKVSGNLGTLTVKKNETEIEVVPASGTKVYDGTALTKSAHDDFTVTGLPEGLTWTAKADGTVTNVVPGDNEKAVNAITEFKIFDADGKDVTGWFTNIDTSATGTLTIQPRSIAGAKVTLAKDAYTCNGEQRRPEVASVVLDGVKLKAGVDYEVSYKNNVGPGTATAIVTGKGDYTSSANAKFKIGLAKAKILTRSRIAKPSVGVSWKAVTSAKKYQLQWRAKGGAWRSVTVKGTSKNVAGLERGKLYQFRVRAVAGKEKGAWSKTAKRFLKKLKSVSAAKGKKSGSVSVKWEADPEATAGYSVVVRTKKGGAVIARITVAAGKTSATVRGLEPGKKVWVQVRPLRAAGGKVYTGALRSHAKYVKVK